MIAPAAMVSRIRVPLSLLSMAYAISPTPIAATAAPMYGTYGASRPAGSTKPSRSAAIGGTRVAFTAGAMEATSAAPGRRPGAAGRSRRRGS